jgi:3-deoxy-D-manno-octulosonate 8-phosphate phosphatase (KDO 8-P phosphatase)
MVTKEKINKIKVMVMDVDGTLTDGKIYMGNNGEVMKAFDIKDGHAIIHFKDFGITPAIITGRTSKIVENRCSDLKIKHFYQGVENKILKLEELLKVLGSESGEEYTFENVAYAGDDLIDLECMKLCGVAVCPADAVDEIKAVSHFVSTKNGGCGAVREFYDLIKKTKSCN